MSQVLVVANRSCPCPALLDEVRSRANGEGDEVLIVAPALNSRLRHWVSDTDDAVEGARGRLEVAVQALASEGVIVRGEVGDAEPLAAIDDALHEFPADEILISTFPAERSHWQEKGLIAEARKRFDAPVHHVVSSYGLVDEEPATTPAAG